MTYKIYNNNCIDIMKKLPENSIDAIVTDPPYGLSFMGKKWDYDVPSVEIWKECLRILKPGGYLLTFAGTRTQHRMAVRIEDAGFQIRDMIAWVYGTGFPKSLDITKALNKTIDESSENAKQWEGWGTALKPALEPITIARKPLSEKTVAENCLKWGTGGINIDACRVGHDDTRSKTSGASRRNSEHKWGLKAGVIAGSENGRFPTNFISDGSDEVFACLPEQAKRFFYVAKSSNTERDLGCEELIKKEQAGSYQFRIDGSLDDKKTEGRANTHPTVKPVALMEYLIKLVSRENALIFDPFLGSGTTGIAALNLGRRFIGTEMSANYFEICKARLDYANKPLEK